MKEISVPGVSCLVPSRSEGSTGTPPGTRSWIPGTRNQEPGTRNAFGLYLHIPFCRGKCFYCDFNSYAGREELHQPYLAALKKEVELARDGLEVPEVASVYFGGGTPTLFAAEELADLLRRCGSAFSFSSEIEVTTEANPETVSLSKLQILRRAGFSRISLGFQSLDPHLLTVLGRRHSREDALGAYFSAREAGFENVNIDLIFGIQGQTSSSWQATLEKVVSLEPEHISTYCLELSKESAGLREAPEDAQAEMYSQAISFLTANGYSHYEISNFARDGFECRHNLNCWRNGEYLGFGAGAHSHLENRRFSNMRDPRAYIAALKRERMPLELDCTLSDREIMEEEIFLGLRLWDGLDLRNFEARFDTSLEDAFPGVASRLLSDELLIEDEGRLRLSERGLFLANEVFERFLGGN